ncbi:uncharacterized protein LOC142319602 [Lycorma delicatula]|uniref:uncharacterized protein LOC142319602 n=1 Tax=Lycorma delicatula TaxID=130591 RepID=UPI003F510338
MENPCFLVEDVNSSNSAKILQQILQSQQQCKQLAELHLSHKNNNNYNDNTISNINNYKNILNNNNNFNQVLKDLKLNQNNSRQEQLQQLFIYPLSNSLPKEITGLSRGQYSEKKPSGISIIYRPHCLVNKCKQDVKEAIRNAKLKKEWCPSGWKLYFVKSKSGVTIAQKVITVLCALILATIITLLATGTVLHLLKNVQPKAVGGEKQNTWFGVVMISGEFRVTNEVFREALTDQQSEDFHQLTSKLSLELDKLYSESILSEEYHSSVVTRFGPGKDPRGYKSGLAVQCWLVLKPTDHLSPEKVGMAFLGGLNHKHGNVWLGNYTVDIQSIGFESKVEEISWSEWSKWSDCRELPNGKLKRIRQRDCILQSGLHLSRADPCFLLDNTPNVDTVDCELNVANHSYFIDVNSVSSSDSLSSNFSTSTVNSSSLTTIESETIEFISIQREVTTEDALTNGYDLSERSNFLDVTQEPMKNEDSLLNLNKQPQLENQAQHVVHGFSKYEKRQCGLCVEQEVCVALKDDPVPYCLPIVDPTDPTGCGGHCKINTEICQRLQKDIYRCVDDSQCLEDEWQCSNRLCIPLSKRCDGYFNCYDNTDEFDCECDLKTHFHCGNWLSCLPNNKRCDGVVDCWDASDEFNCTKDCFGSGQFTCNDSQCIPSHQFCDGFPDCIDHSDEPLGCGGNCKTHEWKCRNNRCIHKTNICDGKDDCGDNSDEELCSSIR